MLGRIVIAFIFGLVAIAVVGFLYMLALADYREFMRRFDKEDKNGKST